MEIENEVTTATHNDGQILRSKTGGLRTLCVDIPFHNISAPEKSGAERLSITSNSHLSDSYIRHCRGAHYAPA